MPHVNIWIRAEDLGIWESIEDRPGFIHKALQELKPRKQSEEEVCPHGNYPRYCAKCSTL